jgi:hypothetical protein
MEANHEVGAGFNTRLEYVLDQICAELPGGGSHELRRYVAERLAAAARAGERSFDRLVEIAHHTLASFDAANDARQV